eukprot:TRINITY_DN14724_c0_g2_i2.p1 TRINITY_DN14724_c0_g2~~TRINITY_DN14724_c0_g2_i2.p1  ORF type:complete len:117 (+),score=14.21 TRINITY_DN14724_c0_g2_i2:413-763(+)
MENATPAPLQPLHETNDRFFTCCYLEVCDLHLSRSDLGYSEESTDVCNWDVGSTMPRGRVERRGSNICLAQDINYICLLYTSDAADEEDSVDLGGRRIIKKKKKEKNRKCATGNVV